ncbi:hypothetical protein [Virgisporangium aurantiacum]|uniref:hypothetical protein n=1 Tax=Virgisporangium aurantiacum TaxID=175570 RepID=UPI001EF369C3|nr:hypothetical protein [Virgisporangium aurantiacum]
MSEARWPTRAGTPRAGGPCGRARPGAAVATAVLAPRVPGAPGAAEAVPASAWMTVPVAEGAAARQEAPEQASGRAP